MPTFRIPTLAEKWAKIKALNWVGECPLEGVHQWIWVAACACAWKPDWALNPSIEPEDAIELIRGDLTRPERGDEVVRAVRDAYKSTFEPGERRQQAPAFNPELMCMNAAKVDIDITPEWLRSVSPVDVRGITPAGFLDHVFRAGEFVAVKNAEKDRGIAYRVSDPESATKVNGHVRDNEQGAWFYTNPMCGRYRKVQEGPGTWRMGACYGDELITSHRQLLLECDHEGFEQEWLKVIVKLPNVVAIYTSGNVSAHALVRVNAANKAKFNRIVDDGYKRLAVLGADPRAMSATRATRLPGVVRGDNGREQRLLYLDPEPDGQPIYQRKNRSGEPPPASVNMITNDCPF